MAEKYTNILVVLGASAAALYTCPPGRASTVVSLQCTNVSAAQRTVTGQVLDASNSNAVRRFAYSLPVPLNGAVDPVISKIFLEEGDVVQMFCDSANSVEVVGSVLEIY